MTTGLIAEQAAFSDLAREIFARLSPGDTRLEYRSSILNGTSVTQFFAFNPSGKYKDP
ncbi:hypothetical protein [Mycetocola saprophilus]|uniref:hypothetical protein n=1 Tax=Mycetocola saprophilus TaxID=76636 RepID=UPI003BF28218